MYKNYFKLQNKQKIYYNIITMSIKITSFVHKKNETTLLEQRRIYQSDYPEVAKIARAWEEMAKTKTTETIREADRVQFWHCAEISHSFVEILENPRSPIFSYEIYACENGNKEMHGLMKISEEHEEIYVDLIVANPKNIRSQVNEQESGRVRGAGTYLLQIAEKRALEKRKLFVLLKPFPSVVPFYLKNGFVWHSDGGYMGKAIAPSRCCAIS